MLVGLLAGLLGQLTWLSSSRPSSTRPSGGQMGGMSSVISQFGGLASLAGIPPGQDAKRAETLAALESAALTERYIAQNDFLRTPDPRSAIL